MAITRQVVHKGETANHWVIGQVVVDYVNNRTRVSLYLYRDEATYEADASNYLEVSDKSFEGSDYSLEDLYAKILAPVPQKIRDEVPAIEAQLDPDGNVVIPAQQYEPALYRETNVFAISKTQEELDAQAKELAIEKLYAFVVDFGEETFDRDYREWCLGQLYNPNASVTRKARILELLAWGDTFWTEYYRVKALILGGNLTAKYVTANVATIPYTIAQIQEV